jgi:hypothetical protein
MSGETKDCDVQLVSYALELYQGIWEDRNTFLHGKTRLEVKEKLRIRIHQQVRDMYKNPPF